MELRLLSLLLPMCCCVAVSLAADFEALLASLHQHGYTGPVYAPHSVEYEHYRRMEIGECNFLYPLLIVRPGDEREVAAAVRAARSVHVELSVRSGGHGYICNGIKNASLHVDMRRFNKVELFHDHYSKVTLLTTCSAVVAVSNFEPDITSD